MDEVILNIRKNFSDATTKQLIFLYVWLKKRGAEDKFKDIVDECEKYRIDADGYQEVIKCITHNLPFKKVLSVSFGADVMVEIRRYMEDTGCDNPDSPFLSIVDNIKYHFSDKNIIYEFRRFNKAEAPITYEQDCELLSWIIQKGIRISWLAVAALYEVYCSRGYDEMMKFAHKYDEIAKDNAAKYGKYGWNLLLETNMWLEANCME